MKEIKVKGKCMASNEWVYGDLIHKRHDRDAVMIQDNKGLGCDVDAETLGQFTNLYDVNDKEIYEGDIVEKFSSIAYHRCQIDSGIRGVVIFEGGAFRFVKTGTFILEDKPLLHQEYTAYKIIGNIHDKPELLNE